MDHLLPAAPWLMAAAATVSAAACVIAWRSVPWQGRQTALVMAAAMLVIAMAGGDTMTGLLVGAVLLVSAMVGTIGVRGTSSAAACCHRALVSLVMAICAFDGASAGAAAVASADASATTGGHAHGFSGLLSVLVIVGVIAVVLWTIVTEWFLEPVHHGRTARVLTVEAWAMAAGVAVMCLGF